MTAPPLNAARPVTLDVAMLVEIVTGLAAAEALWRPHVTHDAAERARLRLLATPAYEVWLLGWTPGQSVGLHDHGDANGAFVVVDGELVETTLTSGRHRVGSGSPRAASGRSRSGSCTTSPTGRRSWRPASTSTPTADGDGFYGADGSLDTHRGRARAVGVDLARRSSSGRCTRAEARRR